jgi:hypothetical protein
LEFGKKTGVFKRELDLKRISEEIKHSGTDIALIGLVFLDLRLVRFQHQILGTMKSSL